MPTHGQETEAKFYIQDLDKIAARLQGLEARLIQARVLETNIRFDLPNGQLVSERRVLRLRHDSESRLTYKSASINDQGVLSRTEIEFIVQDFEKAKQFLQALGYQSIFYYEKYRRTFAIQSSEGSIHIMLDELPYGNFVEIEGETVDSIRQAADVLNLDWDTTIATSYFALFRRARKALDFSFRDLTFENFANIRVTPAHLEVRPADERASPATR
ncbi:MAG TPA: class IV adenylate cyclase [Anaerolineales bacterium]|nr:class IV adenylate cyclase [Anaerolineales bacterium]